MKKIHFYYLKSNPAFRNRERLKQFIPELVKLEKKKLNQLRIIFCSDKYLLTINEYYLGHKYYTDIITFDFSDSNNFINGEIYISIDRVKDNAITLGISYKEELHRVIFHGILHLCGYKDKLKSDQQQMREKEDHYLDMYFSLNKLKD